LSVSGSDTEALFKIRSIHRWERFGAPVDNAETLINAFEVEAVPGLGFDLPLQTFRSGSTAPPELKP